MIVASAWQGQGLESNVWGDGPIAVFRAEGEFHSQLARPMLAHAQDCVADWRSAGLVADYSRSRMAITAETLLSSITTVIADRGALVLPTALVVQSGDMKLWRGYARMLAEAGVVRGVFTDYDEALRWVAGQAAIFTLDARHRIPVAGP